MKWQALGKDYAGNPKELTVNAPTIEAAREIAADSMAVEMVRQAPDEPIAPSPMVTPYVKMYNAATSMIVVSWVLFIAGVGAVILSFLAGGLLVLMAGLFAIVASFPFYLLGTSAVVLRDLAIGVQERLINRP